MPEGSATADEGPKSTNAPRNGRHEWESVHTCWLHPSHDVRGVAHNDVKVLTLGGELLAAKCGRPLDMTDDFIHREAALIEVELCPRQHETGLQVAHRRQGIERSVELGLAAGAGEPLHAEKDVFRRTRTLLKVVAAGLGGIERECFGVPIDRRHVSAARAS